MCKFFGHSPQSKYNEILQIVEFSCINCKKRYSSISFDKLLLKDKLIIYRRSNL